MASELTIEQRLEQLERQFAELRQRFQDREAGSNWLERLAGSFKDDPDFTEILRLGRQIRQANGPPEDENTEG